MVPEYGLSRRPPQSEDIKIVLLLAGGERERYNYISLSRLFFYWPGVPPNVHTRSARSGKMEKLPVQQTGSWGRSLTVTGTEEHTNQALATGVGVRGKKKKGLQGLSRLEHIGLVFNLTHITFCVGFPLALLMYSCLGAVICRVWSRVCRRHQKCLSAAWQCRHDANSSKPALSSGWRWRVELPSGK